LRSAVSASVLGLLFAVALPIGAQESDVVVKGDLGRRLDRAIQRSTGGGFWGAALVARGGEVILAKGYGFADYGSRPNTPRTLFEIASTSKQFTAAAILKLESEKKLRLEDTLGKFFKKVPADKRTVTVHHLLTHTSGMNPSVGLPYASTATRDEFVRHVLAAPMKARPGTKFAYFNSGYALLAAIVEVVSGKSFETYMKEKIFKPAGLADTGFIRDPDLDGDRAAVRLSKTRPESTALDWHWSWGYRGMGGVVTTVLDLLKWDRALRGNDVLDAKARAKYYEPFLEGYACGWRVAKTDRNSVMVFHSGGVQGFVTDYVRHLEDDVVIVVLSNGKSDVRAVTRQIDGILFQRPKVTATLDATPYTLTRYRAAELPRRTRWRVEAQGGGVRLVLEDPRTRHAAATIRMPAGPARKLGSELKALLRGKGHYRGPRGMEAGLYLLSYGQRKSRLDLEEGLEITLLPRYEGRDPSGKDIVDERITFVLVDGERNGWPVMVKMDFKSAKGLLEALDKALP